MAASSSKKASVPEAKEAMSRFKEEVASELGVPLKAGRFNRWRDGQADDHEAGAADEISSAIAGFKCTLQMQA